MKLEETREKDEEFVILTEDITGKVAVEKDKKFLEDEEYKSVEELKEEEVEEASGDSFVDIASSDMEEEKELDNEEDNSQSVSIISLNTDSTPDQHEQQEHPIQQEQPIILNKEEITVVK